MKEYDFRKTEVEEFKKKLIGYFEKEGGYDSTISLLMKEFNLGLDDVDLLEYCLDELVEEKWLVKAKSFDHNEYDPGEKLDFGGLR